MMGVLLREMAATVAGSAPPSSGTSDCCSWVGWSLPGSSGGFGAVRLTVGLMMLLSSTVETLGSSIIIIKDYDKHVPYHRC